MLTVVLAGIVISPLLLYLNLIGQINLPNLLGPIGSGVPTGAFQGAARCVVQEIPIARSIIRVAHMAIPSVPAGHHVAVKVEEVPMMVDDTPLVRRVSAIGALIPVTDPGADPSRRRCPSPHECLRGAVGLDQLGGCAAPVRQVQVRLIHDAGPVSAPGETQGLGNGRGPTEEASAVVVAVVAGLAVAVNVHEQEIIKGDAPLVLGAVGCAAGVGHDLAGFGAALGIEGFLLLDGPQGLRDPHDDPLRCTGLDPLGRQLLQARMT